jgi:O-glycosyl hydrolase
LTEAATVSWSTLSEPQWERLNTFYFDEVLGMGSLIVRAHIVLIKNIFMLLMRILNYQHSTLVVKDSFVFILNLHTYRYVLPLVKSVLPINLNLKTLSSPWSPPAWMKDKNEMIK